MAPVTVAGAITLGHLEVLAALTLTQMVKPRAPVCNGTFTSDVDMKSGATAFGAPAHFHASLAAGQMARDNTEFYQPIVHDDAGKLADLQSYIAKHTQAGSAPPES